MELKVTSKSEKIAHAMLIMATGMHARGMQEALLLLFWYFDSECIIIIIPKSTNCIHLYT